MISKVHDVDLGSAADRSGCFLRDYCFHCDRIGHKMDECAENCDDKYMSLDINRRLGVWLRVTSPPKCSFKGSSRSENRNW
ncbi:hypothetical protein LWI28_028464 [Acer negundo]|uniref:CCHC-type domain-containing protein n=1 Tax=Acer negundo TaxID=4023 RepID=A0AAD5IS02_ACENE|nr:hypothetical protein LWI28_028464 [Acer negundo]